MRRVSHRIKIKPAVICLSQSSCTKSPCNKSRVLEEPVPKALIKKNGIEKPVLEDSVLQTPVLLVPARSCRWHERTKAGVEISIVWSMRCSGCAS